MKYSYELDIAIDSAQQAALLCEQARRSPQLSQIDKSDRSPVTIADFGAQAIICRAIAGAFPDDAIVAEESSSLLRTSNSALNNVTQFVQQQIPDATPDQILDWVDRGQGHVSDRFWTLDPIDGTKGFLRGDQYAIAIALIEQGEVKLGVMACPALESGCLFVAVRGQGTQRITAASKTSIQVLTETDSPFYRLIESVETSHGNPDLQRSIARSVGLTAPAFQMDSQAKYGAIANGQAALYLRLPWSKQPNYQENIWDHAAGSIVVEEAGGRVSDMNGEMLNFTLGSKLVNNRGIVATNGILHDAVLAAIRAKLNA